MPATSPTGPAAGRLGREQRLHHQAVGVGRVAEPAQGHREAALGLGVAPGVGLADQLHQLGVGDVAVPPDPGRVADLLQPRAPPAGPAASPGRRGGTPGSRGSPRRRAGCTRNPARAYAVAPASLAPITAGVQP